MADVERRSNFEVVDLHTRESQRFVRIGLIRPDHDKRPVNRIPEIRPPTGFYKYRRLIGLLEIGITIAGLVGVCSQLPPVP